MDTTLLQTDSRQLSINPNWFEELWLFAEQTYGRSRLQEAWAEFNRWRTPARDLALTHGRFFNTWFLWDWTPDAKDSTLAADIARECTPAEWLLRTRGEMLPTEFREFLSLSCESRLSFFNQSEDGSTEDLLTGCAWHTKGVKAGIRFGLVVSAGRSANHPVWMNFAPEIFPFVTSEKILALRSHAIAESHSRFTPELHRAYGVELFDLYLQLRQETFGR